MAVLDMSKSVQFVIDSEGRHTAVLLTIQAWEALVNWIEDAIDVKIAIQALSELHKAGGRPKQAGWLAWDDVREEWGGEEADEADTTSI